MYSHEESLRRRTLTKRAFGVDFHNLRYNGFTLSDLEASDDLSQNGAGQPGKISPKPLQRVPIGLLPGDYIRNRVTVDE